jgi:hypothetical protein
VKLTWSMLLIRVCVNVRGVTSVSFLRNRSSNWILFVARKAVLDRSSLSKPTAPTISVSSFYLLFIYSYLSVDTTMEFIAGALI